MYVFTRWVPSFLSFCLLPLTMHAQASQTVHAMTLSNAVESIDTANRKVFVVNVAGDLPGVLTVAVVVAADGTVSSGEWALNVSYIQFGPPDADGDGDASETLVQRGVIKGSVSSGSTVLGPDGLASTLSGLQLNVTGATVEFSSVKTGLGTLSGGNMNQQTASSGTLSLNF